MGQGFRSASEGHLQSDTAKADIPTGNSRQKVSQRKDDSLIAPSRPNGILMTPGTTSKARGKTVSFGTHVVDNEGKKPSKSGIPNNCPGKFPSPWTPKSDAPDSIRSRPRTKLTAALYEARDNSDKISNEPDPVPVATKTTRMSARKYAKDDNDITLDVMEPRSESGRYWKEQYDSYSTKSEKEAKKLVAKHHLAKKYAQKKDAEAMELATKLREHRRQHREREQQLEAQVRDVQEQLQHKAAELSSAEMEISRLKQQIEILGGQVSAAGKGTSYSSEEPAAADPLSLKSFVIAESPSLSQPSKPSGSRILPSKSPRKHHPSSPPVSNISKPNRPVLQEITPTYNSKSSAKANIPPSKLQQQMGTDSSVDPWMMDVESSVFDEIPPTYDRMALPMSSAPIPPRQKVSTGVQQSKAKSHSRTESSAAEPSTGGSAHADPALPPSSVGSTDGSAKRLVDEQRKKAARERMKQRKGLVGS